MTFTSTIAAELRTAMHNLERLSPTPKRPGGFTEDKSEILQRIEQAVLMLEGNFDIVMPTPRPATPGKKRPTVTKDAKGNVIKVEFRSPHAIKRRDLRS